MRDSPVSVRKVCVTGRRASASYAHGVRLLCARGRCPRDMRRCPPFMRGCPLFMRGRQGVSVSASHAWHREPPVTGAMSARYAPASQQNAWSGTVSTPARCPRVMREGEEETAGRSEAIRRVHVHLRSPGVAMSASYARSPLRQGVLTGRSPPLGPQDMRASNARFSTLCPACDLRVSASYACDDGAGDREKPLETGHGVGGNWHFAVIMQN